MLKDLKHLFMMTDMESKTYKRQVCDWVKDLMALGVGADTSAIVARDFLIPRFYQPTTETTDGEKAGSHEVNRTAQSGAQIEPVRSINGEDGYLLQSIKPGPKEDEYFDS